MKLFQVFACASVFALSAPVVAHDEPAKTSKTTVIKSTQKSTSVPGAPQHSGGTDANGCHKNHSTGEYHCHKPK